MLFSRRLFGSTLAACFIAGCSSPGNSVAPSGSRSNDLTPQAGNRAPLVGYEPVPKYVHGETVEHYFDRVVPKIEDKDIDGNIDTSIVGHDRDVIRSYMLSLPKWARENVTLVDRDGSVYVNHAGLRAKLSSGRLMPGTDNRYVDQNGHTFSGPPVTAKPSHHLTTLGSRHPLYGTPPASTNTGPYRRVYSDPNVWYAGGLHTVIPGSATNSSTTGPNGDTGYVYGGGWSSSGNDSVDAGLIFSAARGVTNLFYSDRYNYNGTRGGYATYSTAVDYAPNTDLEVDFIIGNSGCSQSCVGDPNSLTDFVWGTYAYGRGFGGTTLGFRPYNLSDWMGSQTVLKAMVSIGQNANSQPDGVYHDGYSFGVIGMDYCGWSGQGFNICYQSAPQAYYFQSVYPSMVSSLNYQYYDEGVNIQIPSQ